MIVNMKIPLTRVNSDAGRNLLTLLLNVATTLQRKVHFIPQKKTRTCTGAHQPHILQDSQLIATINVHIEMMMKRK